MSTLFGKPAATAASVAGDLSKDVQLASPPEDSISALSWSPVANHLAVSSWDDKVRIYDVTNSPTGNGVAVIDFGGPPLDCDWSKVCYLSYIFSVSFVLWKALLTPAQDGQKVVGGGSDKTAKLLDLGSSGSPAQQVAAHDAPIRTIRFVDIPNSNGPMIVTGSWDKTVKYWDLRTPNPAATIQCQERVYAMDVKDKLLVVATAERHVNVINLDDPGKIFKSMQSPLKHQTRAVSCFKEANGFMIGSIEGRCAFQYINEKDSKYVPTFGISVHLLICVV
jgi:mRNA export factor